MPLLKILTAMRIYTGNIFDSLLENLILGQLHSHSILLTPLIVNLRISLPYCFIYPKTRIEDKFNSDVYRQS